MPIRHSRETPFCEQPDAEEGARSGIIS